jgi:energy-coupling factor transporter ATP-binding protein EcfA2
VRLLALELLRFGAFSDQVLDFEAGDAGLHVVLGPNEAGKSTALRAISGALFGIPVRTGDDHRYGAGALRIGVRLERAAGERIHAIRRKGNKNTLLDASENPLGDAALEPFLGGVDRELFETLFGLSHERLREGGDELLAGRGEVGEALFGAVSGLRGLHELRRRLEEEAAAIFLPAGRKPRLNAALERWRQAKRECGERSLRPSDWERAERACADARARRAELRDARQRGAVRLAALHARQADLGRLAAARERRAQLEAERRLKQAEVDRLAVPEALLAAESRIQTLADDRGAEVKARRDRIELAAQIASLRLRVESLLRDLPRPLGWDEIETLRVGAAARQALRDRARRVAELEAALRAARHELAESERAGAERREALTKLPPARDTARLALAIVDATRRGDLDEQIEARRLEHGDLEARALRGLAALPLWRGPLESLAGLPLPPDETVDRFDQELQALGVRRDAAERRRRECDAALSELERRRRAIEAGGESPDADALARARTARDETWERVRGAWLDAGPATPSPAALAREHERRVESADRLADRRFDAAERIAALAELERTRAEQASGRERCDEDLRAVTAEAERHAEAWRSGFAGAGIEPLPPKEMRSWIARQRELARQADDLETRRRALATLECDRERCRSDLLAALAALGEASPPDDGRLATALAVAERVAKSLGELETRRARLQDDSEQADAQARRRAADVERAARECEAARGAWREAATVLPLGAEAGPEAGEAVLGVIDAIFEDRAKLDDRESRVRGIDRDASAFAARVDELVGAVGIAIEGRDPLERAAALALQLERARKARVRREEIEKWLAEIGGELDELARTCEGLEHRIAEPSEGAADATALTAEIARLEDAQAEVERDLERAVEAAATAEHVLAALDGRAGAAEAADEAEAALAEVGALVEQYARTRLAALVLSREVQRYGESHQGPILRRTGALLREITLGSIANVVSGFGESDELVVRCEREDRTQVGVEGLSEGTRDQLYLALRIAALEQRLERAEPMPLILDDVLVGFDDQRARATFGVLGRLASRAQILFFTHHAHLVELAREAVSSERLRVHTLGAG